MSTRLFISHSGDVSTRFGLRLHEWINVSPLGFDPWISCLDLQQGPEDHARIIDEAKKSDMCVSILSPENIDRPWINFEAGLFFSRSFTAGDEQIYRIYTILIDGLKHNTLLEQNHPISRMYHCYPDDLVSLLKFLKTIYQNHSNADSTIKNISANKHKAFQNFINGPETEQLLS